MIIHLSLIEPNIKNVLRRGKSTVHIIGVNPGGLGVATPRFWAGGTGGSWTCRKILLYLIMHRKYVRKW